MFRESLIDEGIGSIDQFLYRSAVSEYVIEEFDGFGSHILQQVFADAGKNLLIGYTLPEIPDSQPLSSEFSG